MAHGLTITGANNTFTIDSTVSGAAALPVVLTAGTVLSLIHISEPTRPY